MRIGTTVLLLALFLTAPIRAQAPAVPENEDSLLLIARAARYVRGFVDRLSNVVVEEHYLQLRVPKSGVAVRRELESDLLFVSPVDADMWVIFRDVQTMDGKKVTKKEGRLLDLLTSPEASIRKRGEKITQEGARYGFPEWPTFNQPLVVIGFLQDIYRLRFRFTMDHEAAALTEESAGLSVVRFEERTRPTILRATNGDLNTSGRIWIEPDTGRVVRTELSMNGVELTTEFGRNERLHIDVPMEMSENYRGPGGSQLVGHATYSNVRTFGVSTDTKIPDMK